MSLTGLSKKRLVSLQIINVLEDENGKFFFSAKKCIGSS